MSRRAPAIACAVAVLVIAAVLIVLAPAAALAGWRVAFLVLGAIPVGAVALLLIARVTGADWNATLLPLTLPLPWLWLAAIPLVAGQALFVPVPHHLRIWLAWPFYALRSALAIGLWTWLGRALRRGTLTEAGAGAGLVAHGFAVTLLAGDWLLAVKPGQPFSDAGMVLGSLQLLAACAAACLLGLGPSKVRRDLGYLLIATCLGLAYLLFVDYLIIWYGNQPQRVGWYLARGALPWPVIAPTALAAGLACPILAISLRHDRGLPLAGAGALIGLALALAGEVALPLAGFGLLLAAALGLGFIAWRERAA